MSGRPSIRAGLLLLPLFAASAPAAAQTPRTIILPAMSGWCNDVALPRASAEREELVDAAREQAVAAIDAALRAANVATSGMPFVSGIAPAAGDGAPAAEGGPPDTIHFEVCVAVPPGTAAPPAPVRARLFPPAAYGVRPCDGESDEVCMERLRQVLAASAGPEQAEQVRRSPILLTRSAAGDSDQALASAFTSGRDRASAAGIRIEVEGTANPLVADQPRPLLLTSSAALVAAGLPDQGTRAAAIKLPQP